MSPPTGSCIFDSVEDLFQRIAEMDEDGNYDDLDMLIQSVKTLVVDHVRSAKDARTASATACFIIERLILSIQDYSEYIHCMDSFKALIEILLARISRTSVDLAAQKTCRFVVNFLAESCLNEDSCIIIECFLEHLDTAPDQCIEWISTLVTSSIYSERQNTIYVRVFDAVLPYSEYEDAAAALLAQCFARLPLQLMSKMESLSAETRQRLIPQVPDLLRSGDTPLLQGSFTILVHLLSPPEPTPISVHDVAAILDSEASEITSVVGTFYPLDACQLLVHFITRCSSPNPDPEQPDTHLAILRSFVAVQLLTHTESRVLIELHGASIARLLLTEGLNMNTANLCHVAALLSYLLTIRPTAVCQTCLVVSPWDSLFQLMSQPPISRFFELLCNQKALFPHFSRDRIPFRLVDSAMDSSQSDSSLPLVMNIFSNWAQVPESRSLICPELLAYIESRTDDFRSTSLLSALAQFSSRREVSLEFTTLSIGDVNEFQEAFYSQIPRLCQRLCDDNNWNRSSKFCRYRLSLLSLIVQLTLPSNDVTRIDKAVWRRFWQWTCDSGLVPLAHTKLILLWRLIFTDAQRIKELFPTASFLDDILQWCADDVPSSTIKSVMLELFEHVLNLIDKQELESDFVGEWQNSPRFTAVTDKIIARRRALEQQTKYTLDQQASARHPSIVEVL